MLWKYESDRFQEELAEIEDLIKMNWFKRTWTKFTNYIGWSDCASKRYKNRIKEADRLISGGTRKTIRRIEKLTPYI